MEIINDQEWNSWIFSTLQRDFLLIHMSDHTNWRTSDNVTVKIIDRIKLNNGLLCFFSLDLKWERSMLIFEHFLHFVIAKCRQMKSHEEFHELIWAPLLLMHQRNINVERDKIDIGEFSNRMYYEREILSAWLKSRFSSIF